MKRPNLLVLYTDQQRWDALGANGNADIQTPNLDRLAAEGLNFDHHFVQNPVCMPSRMSMLTGLYPATLGIFRNGTPLPEDVITLPHLLRNVGYVSANIGKLHFLNHASRDHRDVHPSYGFDHLEISDEPGCYEDAYYAWVARQAPDQLDLISPGLPPASRVWREQLRIKDRVKHPETRGLKGAQAARCRSDLTHSAFVAEQSIEFLRRYKDEPFLCISGFYSPHSPWIAPQEFLDLYDPQRLTLPSFPPEIDAKRTADYFSDEEIRSVMHGYYAMVSEVDHHCGRILACLDELGLTDDTIVLFTADHGEWLGDHLKYGKGFPAHDCISRVPLLMRWPGGVAFPGRTVEGIVEAVDVLPTLLECSGIPVPGHLQGRSLFPMVEGREGEDRDSALTEVQERKAIRTERFRYIYDRHGREMLLDLAKEFGEYRNVADDPEYASSLMEMRTLLLRRLIERERALPREWSY